MTELDPKELRFHLKSLFLCCGSAMTGAFEALIRCYRFKFPLEVTGKANPDYNLFVEISKKLGVRVTETEVKPNDPMRLYAWISDQSVSNQRAWIPEMSQREGDLHVMLPFYLKYHLNQLRKSDPSFPAPKVDSLYIMLIWAECFRSMTVPISNRVLKDLVAWEAVGQLTVHSYVGTRSQEIRNVHRKVWDLSDLAQLYIGFCGGSEGWQLVKDLKTGQNAFNLRSREWEAATVVGSSSGTTPIPRLIRLYSWDLEDVAIITKNAWALHSRGLELCKSDLPRVRQCLIGRLSGKSEDEIREEMGFESQEEYYKWQVSRAIDIDRRRIADPLDNWVKACDYFQIEPTLEALASFQAFKPDYSGQVGYFRVPHSEVSESKVVPASNVAPVVNPGAVISSSAGEFRHSPDYRSVIAVSGQPFVLTPKQAHLVSILHKAWENGTPELSHGYLIEAVFGEVTENRLKKLFAHDEAWEQLFETGTGRGLIRMKLSSRPN